MANPEHLAILKKGVKAWNRWRKEHLTIQPDLLKADLNRAYLYGVNLSGATLIAADLRRANLKKANLMYAELNGADLNTANLSGAHMYATILSHAKLSAADFTGANLYAANFTGANLTGSYLTRADLAAANFTAADLRESDFSAASILYTAFANVDLSSAKGLETVKHSGPSSIGIDTIYRSKGKIPHSFLRKAGVPENFIEYMASLVGTGIEFYSLFISYSTHDQEFAERLHADLQAKCVRCWFAPHDMPGGKKLHEEIDEAIRVHDKLLLILSPASMESEWVKTEISKARKREIREKRPILFPIRLCSFEALRDWECFDADTGKDSAREIREYFIPDFSNWKDHDAYKLAFDRLLEDLHGKPEPA